MTAPIRIRPFTDDDWDLLVEIDKRVYVRYPRSKEQWQHSERTRRPEMFFRRHVIEVEGVPVACGDFGHTDWIDDPDKYWFQILVPRDVDGSDIWAAYLDHALDTLGSRSPTHLFTGMLEDYEACIEFYVANGFLEVHREHVSRLDLHTWDAAQHQRHISGAQELGIRLATLSEIAAEFVDWQQRLHPVYQELVADQPAPDPPRLDTLEEWQRSELGSPTFDPELWVIALDGDAVIGLSQGAINLTDPSVVDCGLTGVMSDYRRRGIGTALKVRLLEIAQTTQATSMSTGNEANNPMYTINLGLGFVPEPDWVMFEKALGPGIRA
jgi:GNAT superfamily N-acetyltransferase